MDSIAFNSTSGSVKMSPPFNMNQANDINAFFSSTAGIITFAVIWLLCVCGMFGVTGYLLLKKEEGCQHDHITAHDAEARGAMLLHGAIHPVVEIELPTIHTNENVGDDGRYHRLL